MTPKKPHYRNMCEHEKGSFLETLLGIDGRAHDLYLYQGHYPSGYGVCIRDGNRQNQYQSWGDAARFTTYKISGYPKRAQTLVKKALKKRGVTLPKT